MRSRNMQRLTDQLKAKYPGVVIYGIGDEAHKKSASGHNEDDTPGSRPEQEDPDSKPEHRAIDVMIGRAFTHAAAAALVVVLTTVPANQRRLLYVIFDGWIYRARNGWKREVYGGSDKHRDHPHVSGTWQDDENTADWILTPQEDDMPLSNEDVQKIWTWDLVDGPNVGMAYRLVNQLVADVAELKARPAGTVVLTDDDRAALIAGFEAAAEHAVRRVLGAIDGATPQ